MTPGSTGAASTRSCSARHPTCSRGSCHRSCTWPTRSGRSASRSTGPIPRAAPAGSPRRRGGLVRSGLHTRVLVVCFEKQSEARAAGATLQRAAVRGALAGGTGSLFSAVCREYIARSGAPPDIGDLAAVKERRNAVLNPYAQIRKPGLTVADIAASRLLWDPIRLLHSSPSSDGACAIVLADERTARRDRPGRCGCTAARSAPSRTAVAGHDNVDPRAGRGLRGGRLPPGGHHRPGPRARRRRAVRALQLVRADRAREPGPR